MASTLSLCGFLLIGCKVMGSCESLNDKSMLYAYATYYIDWEGIQLHHEPVKQ